MKKLISFILVFALAAALGACASTPKNETTSAQSTEIQAEKTTAKEEPTFKLDDAMVRLGKLVKLEETPFVMKTLILSKAGNALGNYNTFKPGETVEFYVNAAVSEADAAKVKVYLAPYVADADKAPETFAFSADYKVPAEEGGMNFKSEIPADTAEGYYNIIFAYENTAAYRIAVKIAK